MRGAGRWHTRAVKKAARMTCTRAASRWAPGGPEEADTAAPANSLPFARVAPSAARAMRRDRVRRQVSTQVAAQRPVASAMLGRAGSGAYASGALTIVELGRQPR